MVAVVAGHDVYTEALKRGVLVQRCKGEVRGRSCPRMTCHPLGLCRSCFSKRYGRGRAGGSYPRWDH